jgi:hypothetical protein
VFGNYGTVNMRQYREICGLRREDKRSMTGHGEQEIQNTE